MRSLFWLSTLTLIVGTLGCGGGGGSDACDSLKIAGGDSCSGQSNVAYIKTYVPRLQNSFSCTGAYISLTSVLTAAHCFTGGASDVLVVSKGNARQGVRVFIHPLYDGSVGSAFDMAVVTVDQPLAGAGPVPVLLSRTPEEGEEVVAYGYGLDEAGQGALGRVESGEAPLKATYTVFDKFANGTSLIISTGIGSTCSGDSGGPVLARSDSGAYGIFGITRAGPQGCGAEAGRPSALSSTQTNGALEFLNQVVPDMAVN